MQMIADKTNINLRARVRVRNSSKNEGQVHPFARLSILVEIRFQYRPLTI